MKIRLLFLRRVALIPAPALPPDHCAHETSGDNRAGFLGGHPFARRHAGPRVESPLRAQLSAAPLKRFGADEATAKYLSAFQPGIPRTMPFGLPMPESTPSRSGFHLAAARWFAHALLSWRNGPFPL